MVRKQIYIDEHQEEQLKETAYRNRISEAEVIRRALTMYFDLHNKEPIQNYDLRKSC